MIHVFTAIAFGDTLITLSLLERVPPGAPAHQALVTRTTAGVVPLLRSRPSVVEVLDHEAALYTVRANGSWRAMADYVRLRRRLHGLSNKGDVFAFEFPDLRSRALVPFGCTARYAGHSGSAYRDRHDLLGGLFGSLPEWPSCARPTGQVRKVLINPSARHPSRWLTPDILGPLCLLARARGWEVTLVDPGSQFGAHAGKVARYVEKPSLLQAAEELRNSDLYFGPDSFFLHLAYYYDVPAFGVFLSHHLPYLLPGMRAVGNFMCYEDARQPAKLEKALRAFAG